MNLNLQSHLSRRSLGPNRNVTEAAGHGRVYHEGVYSAQFEGRTASFHVA
jgi:hypothetical protein